MYPRLPAALQVIFRPETGLDLPYMGFLEIEHAEPGLADSAADGEGQFAAEEPPVKVKLFPVLRPRRGKLFFQTLRAYPDTHG